MSSMNRRQALRVLAMFGAACATPNVGAASCPVWLSADADSAALSTLGREYLSQHPGDREIDRVRVTLSSNQPESAIVRDVYARARADYENGQLVRLSGWYVSLTEARLFAAISTGC